MAFVTIPSGSIDIGDPITKNLFDTIKANEDDLDARVTALSIGSALIRVFEDVCWSASSATTMTGRAYFVADQAFTLTSARIRIFEKGSLTGALEIDLKKNTTFNNTGMTSVFTTKPKITWASASDYNWSTNQVFNGASIAVAAGSVLRLDITELPTGTLGKFYVEVYGEVT